MTPNDYFTIACGLGCFYFALLWFKELKNDYDDDVERNV